jgi:hypothetical protein
MIGVCGSGFTVYIFGDRWREDFDEDEGEGDGSGAGSSGGGSSGRIGN